MVDRDNALMGGSDTRIRLLLGMKHGPHVHLAACDGSAAFKARSDAAIDAAVEAIAAAPTPSDADPAPSVAVDVAERLDRIAGGALGHEADELLVKLAAYMLRDHARIVAEKDREIKRLWPLAYAVPDDADNCNLTWKERTYEESERAEALAGVLRDVVGPSGADFCMCPGLERRAVALLSEARS